MTKVPDEKDAWQLQLTPSIRKWFSAEETTTPINKLGLVIRSADGTKKGNQGGKDFFIDKITDTKHVPFQPGPAQTGTMPAGLQHGINRIDNHTVTLVLYDKDSNGKRKDYGHVVGDFNNWTLSNDNHSQMTYDESAGCWWITLSGLDPSREYAFQYYVGTTGSDPIRVADPYARKILDPSNDPWISASTYPEAKEYPNGAIGIVSVFRIQEESYTWKVTDFKTPKRDNMVIYELLLRDFTESGDLKGATEKLDYLKELGVNAIELMPVQEFDGNDSWGYNPAFFFAMDKAYGTDRMYKEFIDACHQRGMAVILDVVYNHATGANPFAKMWWNASANKTSANNPYFNVDAPHPYSVFHDFNHESPLVREFVKRNLRFLLEEYRVDGFRFDLTKGFTQKKSSESTAGNFDATRVAILKEYNNAIREVKADALVILEHFCDNQEETILSNEGMMVWRNMNHAYCQTAMGYSEGSDFSGTYYNSSSRPANSLVSYMESHDEERMGYKQSQWGNGILKTDITARMSQLATNAAFFFTVPGPKMMWQFGEMGYDISINENGRTGKKPVKWDYLEVPQRKELHDTYIKLISLRFDHPELFNATATLTWRVSPAFWSQGRYITLSSFGNAKHVVVVSNFTNAPIQAGTAFPEMGTWYNYMVPGETLEVTSTTTSFTVPANSFKVFSTFKE
jgi:1,4-alpha-glucan branching enzyme